MRKLIDHVYIAVTIAFTVYGLLIMKWRIAKIGKLPKIHYYNFINDELENNNPIDTNEK